MNLRDRIPLKDADRAPHQDGEHEGCMPLLLAALTIFGSLAVVILVTQPWK